MKIKQHYLFTTRDALFVDCNISDTRQRVDLSGAALDKV